MSYTQRFIMMFGVLSIATGAFGLYLTSAQNEHFLNDVWGGCRPCISYHCGGLGGGMGSCHWEGGDIYGNCYGNCVSSCDSGSAGQCWGLYGECTEELNSCGSMREYKCTRIMGYMECYCPEVGVVGECLVYSCN